jgi:dihydrofolate synthase/folylpolyglutamate synthase
MNKGRFSLDHFKAFLESLGNPQHQLKTVHIAGTNGKGSTTNYLRAILQASGLKVGTFTSPHLEVHNDRIRVNDVYISDEQLLYYGNLFAEMIEENNLSMFEIDTLIAIHYFLDQDVDIALFEVGLGGRLDATNVIVPLVSLITTIGFDHMDILGDTLELISIEKAGIVKEGVPLFTSENKLECLDVFRRICMERNAKCHSIKEAQNIELKHGISFNYDNLSIHLNTAALFQVKNASLAIEGARYLSNYFEIGDDDIIDGLKDTQWKGRFELISTNPHIIIDGAHNTHGISALIESVQYLPKPLVIVFSALRDKETDAMLDDLLSIADEVIVTEFDFYRAASLEMLSHGNVLAIQDNREAILKGIELSVKGSCLITGSLYFISQVRQTILPEILGVKP